MKEKAFSVIFKELLFDEKIIKKKANTSLKSLSFDWRDLQFSMFKNHWFKDDSTLCNFFIFSLFLNS